MYGNPDDMIRMGEFVPKLQKYIDKAMPGLEAGLVELADDPDPSKFQAYAMALVDFAAAICAEVDLGHEQFAKWASALYRRRTGELKSPGTLS